MKKVAVFGSTGSIGKSTLEVIRENPRKFKINTLVAKNNIKDLMCQIEEFKPLHVYIKSEINANLLRKKYPNLDIYFGEEGLKEISKLKDSDVSVSALVGIAGLEPTYNMIKNCKIVAIANKEVLVVGGKLILDLAKQYGTKLLPLDSEHSAIMQCLQGEKENKIDKIILTASGGPFFNKEITDKITVEEALNHPTWSMGKKVSIDSSTMMNKGFEVIEASYLFDIAPEKILVIIHKQSLIHSMVQFEDGTIIADIAPRDMQIPIAYALNYPRRLRNNIKKLELFDIKELSFSKPDFGKFKCLKLAYNALSLGHSYQVVLNAANEVLVEAFLNKKINYTDIPKYIEEAIRKHKLQQLNTIEEILKLDKKIKNEVGLKIMKN